MKLITKEQIMKNKNKAIENFGRIVAILCLLVNIGCKDDAWNEHYDQLDPRLESNILSSLSENPDYSTFVRYLNQTGYSNELAASQSYTVWAPNNAAFEQVSDDVLADEDLLKELIGNHISLFSYNTSSNDQTLVKMFNNKYVEFVNTTEGSTFGGVPVSDSDLLTSNGIVHCIDDVLLVNPNIWGYLNDEADQFPILMDFLTQFNETGFDEANSVKTGSNTLGQPVYDSIFTTTNTYFNTIGDLSSEEARFTFIGLTDEVYAEVFDDLDDYFFIPRNTAAVKQYTDSAIFRNLNLPLVEYDDLNGTSVPTTTDGAVIIEPSTIVDNVSLSNGNLFVVDELNYAPEDIIYKPIRYEIENTDRRTLGSLTDFAVQKKYDAFASDQFTNVVSLFRNPDANNSNNYLEIEFSNVLAARYKINLKFSPIGAAQDTKLKFELTYTQSNFRQGVVEIPPIIVSNLEDGVITIGEDFYDFFVYVNDDEDALFKMKFKIIIDVSEPELILYDRKFGIDYVELVPTE